jgi:CheY-like chemotaxis protein
LESVVGSGTTFTLIIPKELIAKPVIVDGETTPEPGSDDRMRDLRVLLVEDNEVARTAVEELLSGEGACVTTAADGRSALASLDHTQFDVLLLDLNLPDMDGTGVLQRLTESGQIIGRKIVISGDARPERLSQVTALGADEVLAKPVSLARIRAAILKQGDSQDQNGLGTTT